MASEPYTGFVPVTTEAAMSLKGDNVAAAAFVNVASRFMEQEAPLMAVAAGLLRNVHRSLGKRETIEEGTGEFAHRIYITRKPWAAFVVMPRALGPGDAGGFVENVGPAGDHLVVAAQSYKPGFRAELAERWGKPLMLLTFAGTEDKHEYEVYEGE
ncbi:hypothetical protein ABZ281_00660 [Streptomyces sp. NPDC006265]|uniref:hypothetical protein n=1 Tax=Streptomyces sp. NPDC006265 TaxID=3156740 RepID=UPI00339DF0B1